MPARFDKVKRKGKPHREEAARRIKDPNRRLIKVIDLLEANLGIPVWDGKKNALEVLVLTILSQNTTDPNALRGYENLARLYPATSKTGKDSSAIKRDANGEVDKVAIRLSDAARAVEPPDWATVAGLPRTKVANAIRAAGLPDGKSGAILSVLHWLRDEVGVYALEPVLREFGEEGTVEKLSGIKGIGVKTVSVTLIEALGVDLCPVDTHVHRVINRLEIVQTKSNRDKTFEMIKPMIPKGRAFSLHHNLLTFGRTVCTAKKAKCGECFLRRLCPSSGNV